MESFSSSFSNRPKGLFATISNFTPNFFGGHHFVIVYRQIADEWRHIFAGSNYRIPEQKK
jgi:hypothetical protein